jgi:hypothetical protein
MKQLTLAAVGFERYAKTTRRAAFLAEMERIVWAQSWRLNPWDFKVVTETTQRYGAARTSTNLWKPLWVLERVFAVSMPRRQASAAD